MKILIMIRYVIVWIEFLLVRYLEFNFRIEIPIDGFEAHSIIVVFNESFTGELCMILKKQNSQIFLAQQDCSFHSWGVCEYRGTLL